MALSEDVLCRIAGRNCLVTGGTGLIGREAVRLLAEAGAHVASVSLDRLAPHPKATQLYGDLREFAFCRSVVADMDYVFHVAGIKGNVDVTKARPASTFVPFLMMNTNMLEAARLAKVQGLAYCSTIGTYASAELFRESDYDICTPPMDAFPGWAKRMGELQIEAYLVEHGLDRFAAVRPANVYGPGDNFDPASAMVVPGLMARIHAGERPLIVWGDGSAVRDFAYSADVAEGVVLAGVRGTGGRFVNLGSGAGIAIRDLVAALARIVPFDYAFDATKPAGFPRRVMDIALARALLGWSPSTPIETGLRRTWEWFLAHPEEHRRKANFLAADAAAAVPS